MNPEIHLLVEQRARQLGLTKTDIAKRARISRESLYRLLRGEVANPSLTVLRGLARALEISVTDLLPTEYRALLIDGGQSGNVGEVQTSSCSVAYREVTESIDLLVGCNQPITRRIELSNHGLKPTCSGEFISVCPGPEGADAKLYSQIGAVTGRAGPLPLVYIHPTNGRIGIPSISPGKRKVIDLEFLAPGQPCLAVAVLSWEKSANAERNSVACSCADISADEPLFISFSAVVLSTPPARG